MQGRFQELKPSRRSVLILAVGSTSLLAGMTRWAEFKAAERHLLSGNRERGSFLRRLPAFHGAAVVQASAVLIGFLAAGIVPAETLPSFARQTGQPCTVGHTVFPELTPFGRRFKIGGYTLGQGD